MLLLAFTFWSISDKSQSISSSSSPWPSISCCCKIYWIISGLSASTSGFACMSLACKNWWNYLNLSDLPIGAVALFLQANYADETGYSSPLQILLLRYSTPLLRQELVGYSSSGWIRALAFIGLWSLVPVATTLPRFHFVTRHCQKTLAPNVEGHSEKVHSFGFP